MYFHLNRKDNFVTELDFLQYIGGFPLRKLEIIQSFNYLLRNSYV